MGNAAVNQISRPTCSERDSPVGPASPPSPSSLNSPSPSPSLHGALKWEGRWGLKGYSRKRGKGGSSYLCAWDITTQT